MRGILLYIALSIFFCSCKQEARDTHDNQISMKEELTAADILGNPKYLAISYGGYRQNSRDIQPTIAQLKEDVRILAALGIKVLRTYNTHYAQAGNLLEAIHQIMQEDPNFEMYVMLGIWIDCKDAWTSNPDHESENEAENAAEVQRAVDLSNKYPEIVKILAVGNEAMVKWATSYFVQPRIILKWVNYLQGLKGKGVISNKLWITSSDNFASWGGGDTTYHNADLSQLIKAVDFVSMHTYPMHDTHYNPIFWGNLEEEQALEKADKIALAMERAVAYAKEQYRATTKYIHSIDSSKTVHIGETGWASASNGFYGKDGSHATDEYKEAAFYKALRAWTNDARISCFYFEAFDEPWKDSANPGGSENHFGLFTVDGKAKYCLWDEVENGTFKDLSRGGNPIQKTFNGDFNKLLETVHLPPIKTESYAH